MDIIQTRPIKKKKKKKKQEEWLHIVVLFLVFQSRNYVPITLVQEWIFFGSLQCFISHFFFFNLFALWDAFMICNYIPTKLLNSFFNHLKVWLPYCLRKFLWTSLSTAPDFEKKKKKETESFEKLKLLYLMFWTWGWHVSFSLCLYVCIKC